MEMAGVPFTSSFPAGKISIFLENRDMSQWFSNKKKSWIEIDQHLARKSPHRNTQHRRTASVLVSGSSATQPAQPVESSERGRCPRLSKIPTRLGKSKTAWWFQWMGLGELAHRKPPYLMGKLMVSCRFSIQSSGGWNPTQSSHLPNWIITTQKRFFLSSQHPRYKGHQRAVN